MRRVLVLVEGQTEETFFHAMLRGYLADRGLAADCTMVCTSREEGRRANRGGHGRRWQLIERDLRLLLRSRFDVVTTMLDLYGFPVDMPGFPAPLPRATRDRVNAIGDAMKKVIGDPRFVPGVIAHEFEGLLFSEPSRIAEIVVDQPVERDRVAITLSRIAGAYPTPEDINDSPETAPSKRIRKHVPGYEKPRHGPRIAQSIGLATLRQRCPLFSDWLGRLEDVASSPLQ